MKTPIKNKRSINNCAAALREIIPPGSVINSFPLYDGKIELALAARDYFVKAYTDSEPIYHFWKCIEIDSRKVYKIATCEEFMFEDEQLFTVLQDIWHTYGNPYIKSSLFFMLNSYSDSGLVSSGELNKEHYTPSQLSNLRRFVLPENMYLLYSENHSTASLLNNSKNNEYNLIIGGKFSLNLFEEGKNKGIEETSINNRKLSTEMRASEKKIIAVYDYDPKIQTIFEGLKFTFVNQYGHITENKTTASEVIVANF